VTSDDALSRLERALEANDHDVLRYLERRLTSEDAADALGDVMLAAWRRVDLTPSDPEEARMWLFGIARNITANVVRASRRRTNLTDRLREVVGRHTQAPRADEGIEVRDAIGRLPQSQAELVRLVHWDGFTIAEAGIIIGVPASTARTRYQKARADLRAALSPPAADPSQRQDTDVRTPSV